MYFFPKVTRCQRLKYMFIHIPAWIFHRWVITAARKKQHHKTKWSWKWSAHCLHLTAVTFHSNIPLNHSNKAALLGIGSHLTPKVWLESDPRGGTKHSASIPGRVFCNKRTSLTKSESPCWCPARAIGRHTIAQSSSLHWQATTAEAGKSNTHPVTVLSQRRPWHLDMRACVQQHVRAFWARWCVWEGGHMLYVRAQKIAV